MRTLFFILTLAVVRSVLAAGSNDTPQTLKKFQEQIAALKQAAQQQNTMTVTGRDGWLFLAAELRHLSVGPFWGEAASKASRATKPEQADPLPAIVDFRDQLAAMGIELLLVPVPPKAVIYPDFLPDNVGSNLARCAERPDVNLQSFYQELRLKNIPVLDLTAAFMAKRSEPDGALYCRQDSHWSGVGCVLAGSEISRKIGAAFKDRPKLSFTGEWQTVEISGDLWNALSGKKPAREQLRIRRVRDALPGEAIAPDPKSPVILLGDSHSLVFHGGDDMLSKAAGLFDQLALELGFPLDLVAVRGSGATPARINLLRRAQKDPAYWVGKKLVIWCFGAREFTESDGWRKVPLKP